MKTKTTTYLKISLLLLFMAFRGKAFAETYPAYLCGDATTVTLRATAATTTGDYLLWEKMTGSTPATVKTSSVYTDKDYVTPNAATLGVGEHVYRVTVISSNGCPSDASTLYKIYVLPSTTVSLNSYTAVDYCTNASPAPSAEIIATSTPAASLPEGVTYTYTWSATKDGTALSNAANIGDITTSANTLTSTFTMNTTVVGVYVLSTNVRYAVTSGVLKSSDNAGCIQTTPTKQVTVSPKPDKPEISIVM